MGIVEVTCTNKNRQERGVLTDFHIDYDIADTMKFEITVGISNKELSGKSIWYINGTEYGGIVDEIESVSENMTKKYTGRNFRALLKSKIIEPPAGEDYKIVSGTIQDIVNELIKSSKLSSCFKCRDCTIKVDKFKFERYVDLYSGIVALFYKVDKVLKITCEKGIIYLSAEDRIDYSEEMEYVNEDIGFRITKSYSSVNHLICLGKGELKDRMVCHLYVDKDGDIVEEQYYFGLDEVTETYEAKSAESMKDLKNEGINKLGELKSQDSFEVTSYTMDGLKIGDIIGAYDDISGMSVRREITNIIAKIDDDKIELEYSVGGDDPGAAGVPSYLTEQYTLQVASRTILGGIKVGTGFSNENGKLNVDMEELEKLSMQLRYISR